MFINSRAEENLMDEDFAHNMGVPLQRLDPPVYAVAVDGQIIMQISQPRAVTVSPELSPVMEEPDLTGVLPPYHSYRQKPNGKNPIRNSPQTDACMFLVRYELLPWPGDTSLASPVIPERGALKRCFGNTFGGRVRYVFRVHGIPLDIVSDRGPQFVSAVWRTFGKALGTNMSLTSGYHPESNGQAEGANQLVEETLRCVAAKQPTQWSAQLAWVEYAINSLRSTTTGRTPFEVSFGYQPPLFPEEEVDLAVPSVKAHIRRCRCAWRIARNALQKAQISAKRYADRRRRPGPRYQVELPTTLFCHGGAPDPRLLTETNQGSSTHRVPTPDQKQVWPLVGSTSSNPHSSLSKLSKRPPGPPQVPNGSTAP
ncbi:hypothetical protein AOLI_G00276950 [Acnodon oligacanthus]